MALFLVPAFIAIEAGCNDEAEVVAGDVINSMSDARRVDPRVRAVMLDEAEGNRVIPKWDGAQHELPFSFHDGDLAERR
jgi:hypothetical protein